MQPMPRGSSAMTPASQHSMVITSVLVWSVHWLLHWLDAAKSEVFRTVARIQCQPVDTSTTVVVS